MTSTSTSSVLATIDASRLLSLLSCCCRSGPGVVAGVPADFQVCYVGDNKGVLRQLLAMRSKSAIQNSIARGLALDLCKGNYWPSNIESEFLRGSDNVVADMLSRRYQPGFVFHLPVCLVHAKEVKLERRDQSYYHL